MRDKFTEQEGRCFYCERMTWLWEAQYPHTQYFDPKLQATREHLIRQVDGGPDDDDNIVMACMECNTHRGALTADEWLERKEAEARANFEKQALTPGSYREK